MNASSGTKAISNLEYDLLTVLQNKAEAVQMYDTYVKDAEEMNSQPCDKQHVQEIRQHLQEVMQKGKM
jgi:hypothetical protein